jgi:hypothetical protein
MMLHRFYSALKVSASIFTVLLIAAVSLQVQGTTTSQLGQREAEAVADQIMKRFYETLQFETVYREFYVSGELRNAEVDIIINNTIQYGFGPLSSRPRKKILIDFAARERAYVALSNFRWLSSAVRATYEGDETKLRRDANEAFRLYREPLDNKRTWPILTSEQLDLKFTSRLNKLAAFFRQRVIPENFNSDIYKTKFLKVEETQSPESPAELKKLFEFAGMSESTQIYVVRRERFYIYFIEQNGELKMLSFTDRIRS